MTLPEQRSFLATLDGVPSEAVLLPVFSLPDHRPPHNLFGPRLGSGQVSDDVSVAEDGEQRVKIIGGETSQYQVWGLNSRYLHRGYLICSLVLSHKSQQGALPCTGEIVAVPRPSSGHRKRSAAFGQSINPRRRVWKLALHLVAI
jgi:hypothetical protein